MLDNEPDKKNQEKSLKVTGRWKSMPGNVKREESRITLWLDSICIIDLKSISNGRLQRLPFLF